MSHNVAASIRARLRNKAKPDGEDFQLLLARYACERFLYRLGESPARNRCILKGASLLTVWMDAPYRATRDIDLAAHGPSNEAAVLAIIEAICGVGCPEDGLTFDFTSVKTCSIQGQGGYAGRRARLWASLGAARIRVQVDFGFGDAVIPEPEETPMPTILDRMPAPVLRVYSPVTTIAEKFEAMVQLEHRNSRMKDFNDIWMLSEVLALDGDSLRQAIIRCFDRRRTDLTSETPAVLTAAFYSSTNMQSMWRRHLEREAFIAAPPESFAIIGERIQDFLAPVRQSISHGSRFNMHWPAGGPWRSRPPHGVV
ncbi:MAG: nucleotidyl transferase AbiEii/AbiGii toxin family protein [Chloroflexi bacterium]|nr:nucleotidyl transferase AbiEii/AbiGii toxin family protein [Chloroflexota bacterium]MCY3937419.1 nucleotidyl transferase AbiEii/AbiGii toxin family protein [Chloroflexota bacterium]